MIISDDWKDYSLLDAGDGEKLELWGKIKVIRPDPQAIWARSKYANWTNVHMYYHRNKSGGGSWEIKKKSPNSWTINYKNMCFNIRPTGFKHMGLFPEQAVNWNWLQKIIQRPAKILNLFAYTGAATIACLKAGAYVTHVDAAKGMNNQAKDNIKLSAESDCRIITDDVKKFVEREIRRSNKYDGIIMDPPVFGRGPSGELWKLEEHLYPLVQSCNKLLSDNPMFFLINAYTSGYSPSVFGNILSQIIKIPNGSISTGEIGIKSESGIVLPCGMFAKIY